MIRTENLTKRYGYFTAVHDLTLHVRPSEIYGFLGPSGAGKTTVLLMLLGIVPPTSGSILIFGKPLNRRNYMAIKRRVGVVGEARGFYDDMTARQYLSFFAHLYAVPKANRHIENLAEAVGLSGFLNLRLRDYSRSMKQKLTLVRALLPDPDLLILDELHSGLVPPDIHQVHQLIQAQNQAGKTVLIASPVLSELEGMAHRVGIIHRGQLVIKDTVDGLRARLNGGWQIALELAEPHPGLPETLKRLPFVRGVKQGTEESNRCFTVRLSNTTSARADLSRAVAAQGGIIVAMRPQESGLPDTSIAITEADILRLLEGAAAETTP